MSTIIPPAPQEIRGWLERLGTIPAELTVYGFMHASNPPHTEWADGDGELDTADGYVPALNINLRELERLAALTSPEHRLVRCVVRVALSSELDLVSVEASAYDAALLAHADAQRALAESSARLTAATAALHRKAKTEENPA